MAIYVDKDMCKGCKICVQICPKGVYSLTHSAVNKKGYNYAEAIHKDLCIRCKKCEKYCPDFAIYIEK